MSIIFVTLNNPYNNHYLSPSELNWCGQKSGTRDHMVGPGTIVCVRKNSNVLKFTHIGTVISKEELRARSATECARYKLVLKINAPLIIARAHGDRLTHNAVLRHFGFPEEKAYFPNGIYSK